MGRLRKEENQDLPPGIWRRSGRYYVTSKDPLTGKRRQVSVGADFERAKILRAELNPPDLREPVLDCPADYVRYLWLRARTNARTKKVAFTITVQDVQEMIDATGGRCTFSGIPFNYAHRGERRFRPWVPSLDRKDPCQGYTRDNCRIICAYINLAINEFGEQTFLAVAAHVLNRRRTANPRAVHLKLREAPAIPLAEQVSEDSSLH